MALSFTARITIPADVMFRQLGEEGVLLNLKTAYYFGLDEIGTRMWTALTTSDTIQVAFDSLLEEYDVTPEQLKHDLLELIAKLDEQHLITIHDSDSD